MRTASPRTPSPTIGVVIKAAPIGITRCIASRETMVRARWVKTLGEVLKAEEQATV